MVKKQTRRKIECTISESYAKFLESKYGKGIYTKCKKGIRVVKDRKR
mgnify:CR=1 FL=1